MTRRRMEFSEAELSILESGLFRLQDWTSSPVYKAMVTQLLLRVKQRGKGRPFKVSAGYEALRKRKSNPVTRRALARVEAPEHE
jgi:hypothetical protein